MDDTFDSIFHSDAEFVDAFLSDLLQVHAEGKAALAGLLASAHQDNEHASRIAAFLLWLYDGQRFTYNLLDLKSFDIETVTDCMLVLTLSLVSDAPLHETIDGGRVVFEKLAFQWNLGAPGGHA